MARAQRFLAAFWSERWKESYAGLSADWQLACDAAAMALIKQQLSPGLRVRPIQPDTFYLEARINPGDRILFRVESETLCSSMWSSTMTSRDMGVDREASPRTPLSPALRT